MQSTASLTPTLGQTHNWLYKGLFVAITLQNRHVSFCPWASGSLPAHAVGDNVMETSSSGPLGWKNPSTVPQPDWFSLLLRDLISQVQTLVQRMKDDQVSQIYITFKHKFSNPQESPNGMVCHESGEPPVTRGIQVAVGKPWSETLWKRLCQWGEICCWSQWPWKSFLMLICGL